MHTCCALILLILTPIVPAQSPAVSGPSPPATFLDLYNQVGECQAYFALMGDDRGKTGATQAEVDRYQEMAMDLSWLLPSVGNRLNKQELRKALKEARKIDRRMEKFDDAATMKDAYEARCVALYDNFDDYVAALERRLEFASGEPYVELKKKCVTISTDWLSITGHYLGMLGPSVKPVPHGGLPPIDFGSGDRYKIAVAVGSLDFWNTVEIPPPPETHLELLAMDPAEQARLLAKPLAEYRVTCDHPHRPFFRGLDARGVAYWAIACEDGSEFSIWITEEYGIKRHYNCKPVRGYKQPACFEPCSRSACYTLNPKVDATDEYVPYTESVRVAEAPAGSCPEEYGSFITQVRGKLPGLGPGEIHEPLMTIVDAPACDAPDQRGHRTLHIYSTNDFDMLKVDLAELQVPPLRLDRSSGPPCDLLHINANIDHFADLRCRLTGDPDELRQSGPVLTVRGQFANGDPFGGQVEACTTGDN